MKDNTSDAAASPIDHDAEMPSAFERRVRAGRKSWRCFHCGDVFLNPKLAASHFGIDELQTPGCVAVLRGGESHLLDRIRDLQQQLRRFYDEDSDVMRWATAKESDHRAALIREEERGFTKGAALTSSPPGDGKLTESEYAELRERLGVNPFCDRVFAALRGDGKLREALEAMRKRDERNGSLPVWHRGMIDAALDHGFVICGECSSPNTCAVRKWCGIGSHRAALSVRDAGEEK